MLLRLEDATRNPLDLIRLIFGLPLHNNLCLLEVPWPFSTLVCLFYWRSLLCRRSLGIISPLCGLLSFHPLQHLSPLHVLHKLLVLLRSLADLYPHPASPRRILCRNLLIQMVPLVFIQIAQVPDIVVIICALLAPDYLTIQQFASALSMGLSNKFNPSVEE